MTTYDPPTTRKSIQLRWAIKRHWPDHGWALLGWGYFGQDIPSIPIATWKTRREAREAKRGCHQSCKLRVVQIRVTIEAVTG